MKKLTVTARSLRRNQTKAEKILWQRLRNRKFHGCKFKRQYIFGKYIVDFVCLEQKLIIELDGLYHATQIEQDNERTKYLNTLGFKVIRFWNESALDDTNSVLKIIASFCSSYALSPNL